MAGCECMQRRRSEQQDTVLIYIEQDFGKPYYFDQIENPVRFAGYLSCLTA